MSYDIPRTYFNLEFESTPQLSAKNTAQNSVEISIDDEATAIVIRVIYSGNTVTAPFRIVYIDANGLESYSAQITPANTTISAPSSKFHGETITEKTYGAKGFKIRLDDVPINAGTIDAYGVAV